MPGMRKPFDAALVLEASNTRTATGVGSAVAHALVPSHYSNDAHKQVLNVHFDVSALTPSGSTMVAKIEVDSASNFPSATVIAQAPVVSTGRLHVPFSLDAVKLLETGATHIRTGVVITGGTSPSITYSSYMVK